MILLIAGHGAGDPGAIGNGYKEADLTRELVGLIKKEMDKRSVACTVADTSRNYYKYLKAGNKYDFTPYKYVLEVHFNASASVDTAGNGKMMGSMFFISPWEKGHSVEDKILSNLYAIGSKQAWNGVVLSTANYRSGLLVQNHVNAQGVSHGLLETCFISDADDIKWYQSNKQRIAEAIVSGIVDGFKLFSPYLVRVNVDKIGFLNMRQQPSATSTIVGKITENMAVTIVDESNGWGKLKSNGSWVNLSYTTRV